MDFAQWAIEYLPTCEACRNMWAGKNPPKDPPCKTCRVDLLPENAEAARAFFMVKDQVITAGEKVIGLNILAVCEVMNILGVEDKEDCLDRVLNLWDPKRIRVKNGR